MSEVQEALVPLLRELVGTDTTSSRDNAPLIALLAPRLERAGFSLEFQRYRDEAGVEKTNLLAHKGPRAERAGLALVGHTDCVPFDPEWTEALTLTEREGKLYGRGSCDTKAFIAAALTAATRADASGWKSPLLLVFTADEEIGCVGAKRLVDAGIGRARHAIVGEPTSLTPIRAHKGYCLAEVEVRGREGHSAFPETGESAIFRAGRLLSRIETLATTRLREQQDGVFAPPFTTVNVGTIQGGKAKNVIPGACRFMLEWRPIPQQPTGYVLELLEGVLRELEAEEPGFTAIVRSLRQDRGVDTSPDAAVVRFLAEQSGKVPGTVPFGTEAPHMTALGAEACIFGPGDIRVAHQTGEHVPLDELVACEAILGRAITRFCGGE